MEWFSDLTEIVEGLVAWGTLMGWLNSKLGLSDILLQSLRRLRRKLK